MSSHSSVTIETVKKTASTSGGFERNDKGSESRIRVWELAKIEKKRRWKNGKGKDLKGKEQVIEREGKIRVEGKVLRF